MNHPAVMAVVLAALCLSNLFCFLLMLHDKRCAQKGRWRVPERRLFLAAACFGALGGVLGMKMLRHKTRHWHFRLFFPLMLILQIIVLVLGVCWLLT